MERNGRLKVEPFVFWNQRTLLFIVLRMDISPEDEINDKYKQASTIIHSLQHLLEQLETGKDTSVMIQGRIATNLNSLSRLTQSMQTLKNQIPGSKRELWLIKVKKIIDDEHSARSSMEKFILMEQARHAEQEREERRRQQMSNPDGSFAQHQIQQERVRQRLHGDIASVQRSSRAANEIREMAFGVLDTLREQNYMLEQTKRRLLDIANVLGISRTLLRVIERRQTVDQIIVYSAMVGILLLFVLLMWLFRW